MRTATLLIVGLSLLSSQSNPQSQPSTGDTSRRQPAPITLAGCVSLKPDSRSFTFTAKDGTRYRLSGKSIKKYAGQEVEIVGGTGKNSTLTIKGGLQPSPNAAAQAGAIDPAQAAIAAQSAGAAAGTGAAGLPIFDVNRVRGLGGSCR